MEELIQVFIRDIHEPSKVADICADFFGRNADKNLRGLLHLIVSMNQDSAIELEDSSSAKNTQDAQIMCSIQ